MSEELRPCPFCTSDAWKVYGFPFCSEATEEGCPMGNGDKLRFTVQQWNTRPIEDALRAELEVVLSEWNMMVSAIGAKSHGTAIGDAGQIVRERDSLRAEIERLRANACPCSNRGDCNISVSCVRARVAQLEAVAEAAVELRDLVEDMMVGAYQPDSFTLQPIEIALQAAGYKEEDEDDE